MLGTASMGDDWEGRALRIGHSHVPEGQPMPMGGDRAMPIEPRRLVLDPDEVTERHRYDERDRRNAHRFGLAGSVGIHALLAASFLFSFSVHREPEPVTRTMSTFDVSFVPGDGKDAAIPKVAPPKAEEVSEEIKPEPVVSDEPQPQPIEPEPSTAPDSQPADSSETGPPADTGSTAGGALIWTPPAPKVNDLSDGTEAVRREVRVELPKVELAKGASDPVLLSYDQGRFSDATAMSEVARLSNTGMLTMAVTVAADGKVKDCVVTSTSGSRMLDERGCQLIRSYEYRPAQDETGKSHEAIVSEVLEWSRDGKFADDPEAPPLTQVRPSEPDAGAEKARPSLPKVSMPPRR